MPAIRSPCAGADHRVVPGDRAGARLAPGRCVIGSFLAGALVGSDRCRSGRRATACSRPHDSSAFSTGTSAWPDSVRWYSNRCGRSWYARRSTTPASSSTLSRAAIRSRGAPVPRTISPNRVLPSHELADHQQRPPLADHLERGGDGAGAAGQLGQGGNGSDTRGSVPRVSLNIKPTERDRHRAARSAGRARHRAGAGHLRDADRHDPGHRGRPGRRPGRPGLDPQLDERRAGRGAARVRRARRHPRPAPGVRRRAGRASALGAVGLRGRRSSRCSSSPRRVVEGVGGAAVLACGLAALAHRYPPGAGAGARHLGLGRQRRPRHRRRRGAGRRCSTSAPAGAPTYGVTAVLAAAARLARACAGSAESSAAVRARSSTCPGWCCWSPR